MPKGVECLMFFQNLRLGLILTPKTFKVEYEKNINFMNMMIKPFLTILFVLSSLICFSQENINTPTTTILSDYQSAITNSNLTKYSLGINKKMLVF
jgi:hypothetical protein